YVAEGSITPDEYMVKLEHFIRSRTDAVMKTNNQYALRQYFDAVAPYYKKQSAKKNASSKSKGRKM
ncbi:MAG: type IA DNA topoisomerase, partial [bacterium]|nr:type IA DNA topoisomerase [bacterium]MDY4099320.1 type IA DNA topoisomerase [Lachnospiraceae bacterium]